MVKLSVNLAIAAWMFVSAFVLTHSTVTAWNILILSVIVAATALMAFVSVGARGTQVVLALVSIWLFSSAMILPHESLGTLLHDAFVAVVLAFVTLLPSKRWALSSNAEAHAH